MDKKSNTPLYRYRFGDAEFDEARLELHVCGLLVEIEQKPLQVLGALLSHHDEPVSRTDLLDIVWSGRATVDNVLSNAIVKLRKALGDDSGERIVTVPRVGYKLVGPMERIAVGSRPLTRLNVAVGNSVPGRENFRLHSHLGSTGGTEVWLARHFKTREPRVYKISPDGERLAALKQEATVYRLLQRSLGDRDDFVRILDWNFETLPFYLECEYAGDSLPRWASTDDQLAALTVSERVALFLHIAEAVSAAHSVGVLHKDLKPDNILVATRPGGARTLRVADFGSSWLLEPGRLEELRITRHGHQQTQSCAADRSTGTPMYIAPELFAGHAPTVQSDLYALGIMLYQIVVADLLRPMATGWESAIQDEVLRADIAAATDGQPNKRLSSVAELINRLRNLDARALEKQLVHDGQVRAASAIRAEERMRARRPWLIAAFASLAVGLTVSFSLYRAQKLAREDAEHQRQVAEQINRFLSEDLLGAADPSGPGGAHNPTMREVLASAAARLEQSSVTDRDTRASIDAALGNAYFGMSDHANAEKYRRAAVEGLVATRGASDAKTLEADYALIAVLVQTTRLEEAKSMMDQTDLMAGTRLAGRSELSLKAHWTHGDYYKWRLQPAQALTEYLAAEDVRTVVEGANDPLMFQLRTAISWCYLRLSREREAERVLSDLINTRYSPERVGPLFWAQARINYGDALKVLGRNPEAEKVMTDALVELRQSLGSDHYYVAVVQNELSDLYAREGRWQDVIDSLQEAYAIFRKRSGEHGLPTLLAATNLGIVEFRNDNYQKASEVLTSTHDELAKQYGPSSPQAEVVAFYLACALANLRRYLDAEKLIPALTESDLAVAEPRNDWGARVDALRGQILLGRGQKRDGLAKLTTAIAQMDNLKTPGEDSAPFKKLLNENP